MSISEERELKIEKGDTVEIKSPVGEARVVVERAFQYGRNGQPSDWYIEGHCLQLGSIYWKQSLDGGHVRMVKKGDWK